MILSLVNTYPNWFQTQQTSRLVSTGPLKFQSTNQPNLASSLLIYFSALIGINCIGITMYSPLEGLFVHDRSLGLADVAVILGCFLALGWLLVYLAYQFTYSEEIELSRKGIVITKELLSRRKSYHIPIDDFLYFYDHPSGHPLRQKYIVIYYGNPPRTKYIYFGQNLSEDHFELVLEYVYNYEIWLI